MITIERNERDYPYFETPENWTPIIKEMINEIDLVLSLYNLESSSVEYTQVKEKFGKLCVYYLFKPLFDLSMESVDGDELLFYKTIDDIIYLLIEKAEKTIDYKVKKGLL